MRNIVIDLGNLEYLYSDTINAFIASNRHMLEVSGRIAILTEHPKVQDILKRAGLDNIMRIYRSEAEMIADAKEILRQTSSYRIDELQKAAATSSQSTIQIPPQIVTPAPIPKGEFEDFRFEMGQQLETKLDNNEVPQYQYGGNAQAKPATPPAPPTPPAYVPPVVQPPVQYTQPTPPQTGYGTGYVAPQYGQNENPNTQGYAGYTQAGGYQQGGPGAPAAFNPEPRKDENAPYDFPTVQLPVGGYAQPVQPPPSTPDNSDQGDDLGQRGRLGAEDRLRSPNARKGTGRRVGGREGDEQPQAPETSYPAYSASIPPDSTLTPGPREAEPAHFGPISTPSSLVEEKASSSKLFVFAALFIVFIAGIWFFTSQESPEDKETVEPLPDAQQAQPQPTAPLDTPVVAAPAPVDSVKAVQPPTDTPPVTAKPEPVKPEPVKPEPKQPPVAREPKPIRPKTPKAPKPEPEYVAPVKPTPEETPAATSGEIRVVSDPPGAEVLVNFSKKGVTPLTIALGNNTNRIIIRKDGYKRYETTLSKNTAESELSVSLDPEAGAPPKIAPPKNEEPDPIEPPEPKIEPKPEPVVAKPKPPRIEPPVEKTPPPDEEVFTTPSQPKPQAFQAGDGAPGIIFLSSSPARADIIVDGKDTGKKTPAKMELPSGPHRIEMSKNGQKAVVEHVVNEGKNKALHLNLQ